jgi:hypothetical protein
MKAYLDGGPADGRVIPHPNTYLYLVHIPKSIDSTTIADCLQESINDRLPIIPTATYQFTGQATISLNGTVHYMIYKFTGME